MLHFLRTYADCSITTGKILRDEPTAFDDRVLKAMDLPIEVYFDQVRKVPMTREEKVLLAKEKKPRPSSLVDHLNPMVKPEKKPLPPPCKPVAIMTNSLPDNLLETGHFLYRDHRYKKLILTEQRTFEYLRQKPTLVSQLEAHNNVLVPFDEKLTLRKAIAYLQSPNPASARGFE